MNEEIKEILEYLKNDKYAGYKEQYKAIRKDYAKVLLDYITNLQEKVNQYENPDDMTLFYMWLDEKAKDKMKELKQKNERLKENNQNMQIEMARTWEENERLKQDIKDACIVIEKLKKEKKEVIEYIKKDMYVEPKELYGLVSADELLNILGGDKE